MKKISKRILALLLAMIMVLSMAACGKKGAEDDKDGEAEELSYDEKSAQVYDAVFSEFEEIYATAKEAKTLSERISREIAFLIVS